MATLTINPVYITAECPVCPAAVFLSAKHADACVVQFDLDAAKCAALGPFDAEAESGRVPLLLYSYTLDSLATRHADRTEPWRNSQLLGQRFAELSIPVTFADQTPGRLILMQWTTARLQSLVAPRAYGIPVRSAAINLETHGESQALSIREEGMAAALLIQLNATQSGHVAPNPRLFDRRHAFTLSGNTARGHRSEFLDVKASPIAPKLVDGSLFASVLPGIDSLRPISAQRVASCTVNTSLPLCLNGPACGLSWNELKK